MKHLKRKLSAAQRDQLLLKEAKGDAQLKRDVVDALCKSNESLSSSMQQMSNSMFQVAQAFTTSIETMARAMAAAHQELNTPYNVHPQYDPCYGNVQSINNYAGPACFRFQMQHSTGHPLSLPATFIPSTTFSTLMMSS